MTFGRTQSIGLQFVREVIPFKSKYGATLKTEKLAEIVKIMNNKAERKEVVTTLLLREYWGAFERNGECLEA